MKAILLVALACFVGCSAADPLPAPPPDGTPTGDAGPTSDTHTPDVAPDTDPSSDATPDAGTDAGTPSEDGAPDALPPPAVDAGHHDARDGAPTQEGGAVDGARNDALDAATADRPDALDPIDAHLGGDVRDGGDGGLICQAEPTTCANAQKAADAIAVTFASKPCTGSDNKCGGVSQGGVTVTYPLTCQAGVWVLSWCVTTACYQCSVGCAAGQLCGP